MEGVRTFLESSTIHGLTYISTTRKYARILWIIIVLAGFIGASLIIKESLVSWSESPIKTTIETLPISEIKFPKVTVCPPKNTFTDLNYDLLITENRTMTEEMKDEILKHVVENTYKDSFAMNNWTKLHEENRFYNWYHGYTGIYFPEYGPSCDYYCDMDDLENTFNYKIYTYATSGVVTTQYYGDKFQPDLVERELVYTVSVRPPRSARKNENVTLHLKLEKLAISTEEEVEIEYGYGNIDYIDAEQTTVYTNFTPPSQYEYLLKFRRVVTSDDIETMEQEFMPGFRLSWWYTDSVAGEVTPEFDYCGLTYTASKYCRQLVR